MVTGTKVVRLDSDACSERVYRLHFNSKVKRCDRFANAGALLALAASAAVDGVSPELALGSLAAGTAAGLVFHKATARGAK